MPDIEIHTLNLKMTFNHLNSGSGLFSQKCIKKRTPLILLSTLGRNDSFTFFTSELTFWWPWIEIDLKDDLESPNNAMIGFFHIFSHLTLKLTFWPWRWPWIIKIISEMDCPVKITWKCCITLVSSFICRKIIFYLVVIKSFDIYLTLWLKISFSQMDDHLGMPHWSIRNEINIVVCF